MKVYQVVRRGSRWHVHMRDASPVLESSEDRSKVVAWACEFAQHHDGEVQVRDTGGGIEMTYTYVNGVEQRHEPKQSRGRDIQRR